MRWRLATTHEAQKEFYDLPKDIRTHIREVLRREVLKEFPRVEGGHLRSAPGWFSLRVGKYRVVFEPDCEGVTIHQIYYGTLTIFAVWHRRQLGKELRKRYLKYRG